MDEIEEAIGEVEHELAAVRKLLAALRTERVKKPLDEQAQKLASIQADTARAERKNLVLQERLQSKREEVALLRRKLEELRR